MNINVLNKFKHENISRLVNCNSLDNQLLNKFSILSFLNVYRLIALISMLLLSLAEAQSVENFDTYQQSLTPNENTAVSAFEKNANKPFVSLSATKLSIVEGEKIEITVSLDPAPTIQTVQVKLVAEDIGIGKGYFSSFNMNPIVIGTSGVNTNPIFVHTNADNFDEHHGKIRISVATDSNLYHPDPTARGRVDITVFDNDTAPTLSITAKSMPIEGNNTNANLEAIFEVTLSSESYKSIRVYYATSVFGSATGTNNHEIRPGDFIIESGVLSFTGKTNTTAGITHRQITITIIGDTLDEENETLEILLTNAENATIPAKFESTIVEIIDDDVEPELSINSLAIKEGNSGEKDLNFIVSLSSISGKNISIEYNTMSGTATAGEDFTAIDSTLTIIPSSSSSISLPIKVRGDMIPEADETFTVTISNAKNATISDNESVGFGTIISDDSPAFGITNATGSEMDGVVKFLVTLTPVSNHMTKVLFYTDENSKDSADVGKDFYTLYRELTFRSGERIKQVEVPLYDDNLDENEEEFTVLLTDPTGGAVLAVGNNSAKGKILDDDPIARISIHDAEIIEGNTGSSTLLFPVSVESTSGRIIRVKYSTPVISAMGVASSTDFVPIIENELEIAEGTKRSFIPITIIGDDEFEPDERFIVVLSEPTSAEISRIVGAGIILNDDPEIPRIISITAEKINYIEGENIVFWISAQLPSALQNIVRVPINLIQKGDFLKWRTPKQISLKPEPIRFLIHTDDDLVNEPDGTITASIEKVNGVFTVNTLQSSVTVNIIDNDNETIEQTKIAVASNVVEEILTTISTLPPSEQPSEIANTSKSLISVIAISENIEEGALVEFEIASLEKILQTITVKFRLDQVGDFVSGQLPNQVNLTQMQSSIRINLETHNDTIAEEDGQITLTLNNDASYSVSENKQATVFISDNADRITRKSKILTAIEEIMPIHLDLVGAHSIGITNNRIRNSFNNTLSNGKFEYAGKENLTEILTAFGDTVNTSSKSLRSIIGNTSFKVNLTPKEHHVNPTIFWGTGEIRRINSRENAIKNSWDSNVFTSNIGLDTKFGEHLVSGFSLSTIESDFDFEGAFGNGFLFQTVNSSINPYFGWSSVNQFTKIGSVAGFGLGNIELKQNSYEIESTDSTFYKFGIYGDHQLYLTQDYTKNSSFKLEINGNSWMISYYLDEIPGLMKDLEYKANQHQVTAVGSYERAINLEDKFESNASIALRRNQVNQVSKFGLVLSNRYSYLSSNGLSLNGNTNLLIAKKFKIRQFGIMNKLSFDYDQNKLGMLFDTSAAIGHASFSNSNLEWRKTIINEAIRSGEYSEGLKLKSELGYGILLNSDRLTPFVSIELSRKRHIDYHLGIRMLLNSRFNLELEGIFQTKFKLKNTQELHLRGGIKW